MDWQQSVNGFLSSAKHPLIVILGPTASGKTGLSVSMASSLVELGMTGEIINADSRQLYKHMDIGTAKVTPEERSGIVHHLLDVLEPNEEATAGWYQIEAKRIVDDLHKQQVVPILVGGSMLYVSSVIDGLTMAPEGNNALRRQLMEAYDQDGGVSLYAQLQEVDPEAAERVHRNNKPRLVRAVEIIELTKGPRSAGVPDTELQSSQKNKADFDGAQSDRCPYDLLIFGLEWPREVLHERINQRTEQMFAAGWLEEVQNLLDRGYTAEDPGLKSHGYREIMHYLQHGEPASLAELQEMIAAKTRQYARRQLTWWRGDKRIKWLRL